jgi:hypothetical protein
MQARFKTVDHRMESFAALFGRVPYEARRLQDYECHEHAASWIRRVLGKGLASNYVIVYTLGQKWWTFCFARQTARPEKADGSEAWMVEAYDSSGNSWSDIFHYVAEAGRWYRPPTLDPPDAQRSHASPPS